MTLGQSIAHHRGRLRLSQLELAEQLNVSRQSVSKWETDASTPDLEKLVELARLFDITLDELVKGEQEEHTPEQPSANQSGQWAQPSATERPPSGGLTPRGLAGMILIALGTMGFLLGFLIPLLWISAIPALLTGVYLLNPSVALVMGWWFLFVPLLFVRSFTSISLETIFTPYFYTNGIYNHLVLAFLLWAVVIFWTVCAVRSTKYSGRRWLAIGWGCILVVCPNWSSLLYWAQNLSNLSDLPLSGWLRIGLSVVVPLYVVVMAVVTRKK